MWDVPQEAISQETSAKIGQIYWDSSSLRGHELHG